MILLLLPFLFQTPEPPAREKASSITYVRPKGWTRQEMPNGIVALIPPDPDSRQCAIFILQGQRGQTNELVYHNTLFQSALQGSQVDGTPDRAYRGSWQFTRARTVNAQRQNSWIGLYTTRVDDRLEGVMVTAATEELFKKHRFTVERLVVGIDFPGAKPPPPSGGTDWTPAPVPDKARDVPIVGAWLVARMELVFSADPKFGAQKQMQTVKVVALFENKVAAKVDARSTGVIDSTYPAEGLATMNISDASLLAGNRRFGTWSEEDGKIRIKWNQGAEDVVERVNADLKGNGILWSAIKSIDGLRLDATYTRPNDFGLPYLLALRKDGTFDTDQVNETIGGKQVNKKMPEIGSGTYEFRKWSLILRFDTGFVQSIHVEFVGDDPAASKSILINGYAFDRSAAAGPAPAAAGPVAVTIQGLVIPLPADWMRKDDPSGGVFFFPPKSRNPTGYYLLVSPAARLEGTPDEAHRARFQLTMAWAQLGNDAKVVHSSDKHGLFTRSTATGKTAAGENREIQLFTVAHDGVLEAVTTANPIDADAVLPILKGIKLKAP
ncbi:MAG TPA: hypothetical protein VE981_06145 [Planctomycetota bacterium]|nr:hypothetical protein [Planctomycetota bacterium]